MKREIIAGIVGALAIVVLVLGVYLYTTLDDQKINSFEDCVSAGYPIFGSNPRQCRADGIVFYERDDNLIHYCTAASREAEACTQIYKPVCGWFNPDDVQCIRYPCAQTYSNECLACVNEDILYWTDGDCPD